jgi:homoserine O-acetyltransferase
LWGGWAEILGDFDGSEASLQDTREQFGRLMALTLWTPDYLARTIEPEATPGFLQAFTPQWEPGNVHDHRAQALAMLTQDVRSERLPEPRPQTLVVVSRTDMVVTPGPSLELAQEVGLPTLILEGDCGHLATTMECQGATLVEAVQAFLAAP